MVQHILEQTRFLITLRRVILPFRVFFRQLPRSFFCHQSWRGLLSWLLSPERVVTPLYSVTVSLYSYHLVFSLFLFQSERVEKGQGTWRHTAASLSNVTLLFQTVFISVFSRDMQQHNSHTCAHTHAHTIPLQFWGDQLQDFNRNVLVIAFALSWTTFNLISKTSWNSIFCWITGKPDTGRNWRGFIFRRSRFPSHTGLHSNIVWNCTNIYTKNTAKERWGYLSSSKDAVPAPVGHCQEGGSLGLVLSGGLRSYSLYRVRVFSFPSLFLCSFVLFVLISTAHLMQLLKSAGF